MPLCTQHLVRITLLHRFLLHYRFQKFCTFGAHHLFVFDHILQTSKCSYLFMKMLPHLHRAWKSKQGIHKLINEWMRLLYLFTIKKIRKKISYSSVWFSQTDVAPVFESVLYLKLFISYFTCSTSTKLIIGCLNNTWDSLEEEYLVFISAIIFVSAIELVTC